jgi:hypothetical protein
LEGIAKQAEKDADTYNRYKEQFEKEKARAEAKAKAKAEAAAKR